MESDQALGLISDMLWACVVVSAPILLTTLILGVAISVVQVATQIQEMTLSSVPKLLATAGLLIMIGPWMMERLTGFARALFQTIPELVR